MAVGIRSLLQQILISRHDNDDGQIMVTMEPSLTDLIFTPSPIITDWRGSPKTYSICLQKFSRATKSTKASPLLPVAFDGAAAVTVMASIGYYWVNCTGVDSDITCTGAAGVPSIILINFYPLVPFNCLLAL